MSRSSRRRWPRRVTTPPSPPPTSTSGWPCPTAWPPSPSTCGTTAGLGAHHATRSSWRWSSRRRARAADPRIRQVRSADYGDGSRGGGPGLDDRDPAVEPQDLVLPVGRRSSPVRATPARPGAGFSVGRGFDGLDPDKAVDRRGRRGPSACSGPPRVRRAGRPWSSTAGSPPPAVGRLLGAVGRGGDQGPLVLRRPDRRGGRRRRRSPWSTTPPTPGPTAPPPTTPRVWPAGATC